MKKIDSIPDRPSIPTEFLSKSSTTEIGELGIIQNLVVLHGTKKPL